MRKIAFTALPLLLAANLGFGQDLNRLQDRAQKLLQLRSTVNLNKAAAAPYIESAKRQEFLESRPFPLQDVAVVGYEFTDDPKLVYVVFKGKVILPEIGAVPRTAREPWIWDKKEWFLRIEDLGNPFASSKKAEPFEPAKAIPFEFSQKRLDLGKHTQGEILKGTIAFKSDRDEIKIFLADAVPGLLAFGTPVWKSKDEAEIEYVLDTGLATADIQRTVEFRVIGFEEQHTRATFDLSAQIEPRFKITQQPEIINPDKPATVQIRVENVSKTPFSFKSLVLTNPAYQLLNEPVIQVDPGQTSTVVYAYNGQTDSPAAQLNVEFVQPITGRSSVTFPLNIRFPEPPRVGYTKQQLDNIVREEKNKH